MMAAWQPSPEKVAADTQAQGVDVSIDDVMDFVAWAKTAGILRDTGPGAATRLLAKADARRHGWATWTLHNYLFLRLRLGNPDRILTRLLPVLGPLYSPPGIVVMVSLMFLGLMVAARQIDAFVGGLVDLASLEGAAAVAVGLSLSKLVHELGHGIVAKRLGLRVPSAGVAFIVLWPVLWVDATEAWRVKERRSRLLLDMAGVLAECAFSALATLAWAWSPDGLFHQAALAVAGGAWIATLSVNLNPFMRFDGYYLLSDTLGVANMQERAFDLARWRMRRLLLGSRKPVPEILSPRLHWILIGWAWATWVWRAVLFWGIAVVVYHLSSTKLVGIFLGSIEVWVFLASPVVKELKAWCAEVRERGMNMRVGTLAAAVVGGIVVAVLPVQRHVILPAMLRPTDVHKMAVSEPGDMTPGTSLPRAGTHYAAGEQILALVSPELARSLDAAKVRLKAAEETINGQAFDQARLGSLGSAIEDKQRAEADVRALMVRQRELHIIAPFTGTLRDVPEDVGGGNTLKRGEGVGLLVADGPDVAEAYAQEDYLHRIMSGQQAEFIPEQGGEAIPMTVRRVSTSPAHALASPELSSLAGGHIRSRLSGRNGESIPEEATFRVDLEALDASPSGNRSRGIVRINAEAESLLGRAGRWLGGVFIRESGL